MVIGKNGEVFFGPQHRPIHEATGSKSWSPDKSIEIFFAVHDSPISLHATAGDGGGAKKLLHF